MISLCALPYVGTQAAFVLEFLQLGPRRQLERVGTSARRVHGR